MARILCVWELGSHLGHLSHLRPPIEVALGLGHQVFLAARALAKARQVLGDLPITYLPAPFKQDPAAFEQHACPSYTHLLARQCFQSVDELEMYLRAWRALFDLVQPELVLFEHSPTALIASRACRFRKVLVGNGFTNPPTAAAGANEPAPFAPFPTTAAMPDTRSALCADDAVLLKVINLALARLGIDGFDRLHTIYAQADAQFLMTLPVLDHFGERPQQRYLGVAPPRPLATPVWPTGPGPRLFGYLLTIASLERLLQDLRQSGACTLLYVHALPARLKAAYSSEHLRFSSELVDLGQVAQQADGVISHGNHNTTACFVQAGLPQLLIPLHQEHLLLAKGLLQQGCALMAYQDQHDYDNELAALVSDPRLRQQAARVRALCPDPATLDASGHMRQTFLTLLA